MFSLIHHDFGEISREYSFKIGDLKSRQPPQNRLTLDK